MMAVCKRLHPHNVAMFTSHNLATASFALGIGAGNHAALVLVGFEQADAAHAASSFEPAVAGEKTERRSPPSPTPPLSRVTSASTKRWPGSGRSMHACRETRALGTEASRDRQRTAKWGRRTREEPGTRR